VITSFTSCGFGVANEPELLAHAFFNLLERLRVLAQKRLCVFASLAEPFAPIYLRRREPGAAWQRLT
jgi:hypothetical protein